MELPSQLNMHNASILPLSRGLSNLSKILDKAIEMRDTKSLDDSRILNVRLVLDMVPFVRQIQIACDTAKGAAARLTGTEAPVFEDNETTLEDLKARIEKTLGFINSVPAEKFEASETREFVVKFGPTEFPFVGYSYLTGYVLPNFYFHSSIAYALLRQNGLNLGKLDFLGS